MSELLARVGENWLLHQLWLAGVGLVLGALLAALWELYRLGWRGKRRARREYIRSDLLFSLVAAIALVALWFSFTDGSFYLSSVLALVIGFALSRRGWEKLCSRLKPLPRRPAAAPSRQPDIAQRLVISSARQGKKWSKGAARWAVARLPRRRSSAEEGEDEADLTNMATGDDDCSTAEK